MEETFVNTASFSESLTSRKIFNYLFTKNVSQIVPPCKIVMTSKGFIFNSRYKEVNESTKFIKDLIYSLRVYICTTCHF